MSRRKVLEVRCPTARTSHSGKIITLRPDLRFDDSYDTSVFGNGTQQNQFVASMDLIIGY